MAKGKQRFPIPTATVKANAARGAKRSGKRSRIDPSKRVCTIPRDQVTEVVRQLNSGELHALPQRA